MSGFLPDQYQPQFEDVDHRDDRIAIIGTKWNAQWIDKLYEGAADILKANGVTSIKRYTVPGAYELPLAAEWLCSHQHYDAIICLGIVLKGATKHNEYISQSVATNLHRISLRHQKPILFGVLTPETEAHIAERAGGKYGNKGAESAIAALEMIDLWREIQ
jgi:6,7-dimethyl-8-ribityllumazine synthase